MSDGDIPNFDEDPTINTVSKLYQKQRPPFRGLETKVEMEGHFGGPSDYNPFGTNDLVQPCGVTDQIYYEFFVNYKFTPNFNILLDLLEKHPVYGSPEISKELIRLLKKARVKPISDKQMGTKFIHKIVKEHFSYLNPEKGQVDAAYTDIAAQVQQDYEVTITVDNVRNIIKRARKSGWNGEYNWGLNINQGSSSDNS